jgi:hypothetical protein
MLDGLVIFTAYAVGVALIIAADGIGRLMTWGVFDFPPYRWLNESVWGVDNPNFTRGGVRTLTRWWFRIIGVVVVAFAFLAMMSSLE